MLVFKREGVRLFRGFDRFFEVWLGWVVVEGRGLGGGRLEDSLVL